MFYFDEIARLKKELIEAKTEAKIKLIKAQIEAYEKKNASDALWKDWWPSDKKR